MHKDHIIRVPHTHYKSVRKIKLSTFFKLESFSVLTKLYNDQ